MLTHCPQQVRKNLVSPTPALCADWPGPCSRGKKGVHLNPETPRVSGGHSTALAWASSLLWLPSFSSLLTGPLPVLPQSCQLAPGCIVPQGRHGGRSHSLSLLAASREAVYKLPEDT